MSKTGTFYIRHEGRLFCVEPISKHAGRNADWENGIKKSDLPTGGAIHPDDSVITDKDFKNIQVLGKGVSPLSFIKNLIKDEEDEQNRNT